LETVDENVRAGYFLIKSPHLSLYSTTDHEFRNGISNILHSIMFI